MMPGHKYGARKTAALGRVFDSKAEADRAVILNLKQAAGEIRNLSYQPRFVLVPSFTDNDGENERAIAYTADFKYEERAKAGGWHTVVEDVKGVQTPDYVIRRKLFKRWLIEHDFDWSFRETGGKPKQRNLRVVGGTRKRRGI